jgi:hypothetical protein
MRFPLRLLSPFAVRRSQERRPLPFSIDWRVFGSKLHRVSVTADVSRGGTFVLTSLPEAVGTPVVVELETSLGKVERHARVAWRDQRGMGLRFTRALASSG